MCPSIRVQGNIQILLLEGKMETSFSFGLGLVEEVLVYLFIFFLQLCCAKLFFQLCKLEALISI